MGFLKKLFGNVEKANKGEIPVEEIVPPFTIDLAEEADDYWRQMEQNLLINAVKAAGGPEAVERAFVLTNFKENQETFELFYQVNGQLLSWREMDATVEWIDGNLGAKTTMKYPSVYLDGEGARGTMLSIAFANAGQHQDTGAKMIHNAPHTSSSIVSKSIAKGGGKVDYRGQVTFNKNSKKSVSHIECDTIIMDDLSASDTIPFNEIHNSQVALEHEAKVSKISEEQLYYLMSRGLSESEATEMIVMGFVEPFTKELPMEYAVELNRLISYEMEGSVG